SGVVVDVLGVAVVGMVGSSFRELPADGLSHPGEVLIAGAHRVIRDEELTRERSIAIERVGRGPLELFVGEGTDCGRSRGAVGTKEMDRRGLSDRGGLLRALWGAGMTV